MKETVTQPVQTVVAVEHDGLSTRVLAIKVRILSQAPNFDIRQAVKDACTEYVQTEQGRKTYLYNCRCFNWADFESEVPNELCRKHGFERIDSNINSLEVNWDEHLVNDDKLPEDMQESEE